METTVKAVAGLRNCFVALPLPIIYAIQSTAGGGGVLPPVLPLDVSARDGRRWRLAWSGAASRSHAIEIALELSECISLQDGTPVQVKALANIPKAVFVTIEPSTEDDWEILELNSELAEKDILKQVGIVHEGMRFPIWLHGHVVMTFIVVSTSPKNSVVQLVPGSEVAVAPKNRKQRIDDNKDVGKNSHSNEQSTTRRLLRLQPDSERDLQKIMLQEYELGVFLTSAAFIHPHTARKMSFDNLQVVMIFPRTLQNEILKNSKDATRRKETMSSANEEKHVILPTEREIPRQTVVRLIFSELVAAGHILLPHSLRLFLRQAVHSWVYVDKCRMDEKMDVPLLRLSPCRFKLSGSSFAHDSKSPDLIDGPANFNSKNMTSWSELFVNSNLADWSLHDKVVMNLSSGIPSNGCKEVSSEDNSTENKKLLVYLWLIGQVKAISLYTGVDIMSVVLSKETLLHFELKHQSSMAKKEHFLECYEKSSNSGESAVELLYLLAADFDASYANGQGNMYEVTLNDKRKTTHKMHDLDFTLGKLEAGDPVALESTTNTSFNQMFKLRTSSLRWMEAAFSDVSNRLIVLLSPFSGMLLSIFNLPHPGHIFIYGPSGCGKTSLALAAAKHMEEHTEILAHIVFVSCSKLALEKSQTVRQSIAIFVSEALCHVPSVIVFDDLDHIINFPSEVDGSQPSNTVSALVQFLTDIIDEYGMKHRSSCGYGPIAFIASMQSLGSLPQALRSSGRFDFHVQLPAPAAPERGTILKNEIQKRILQCPDNVISDIASKCDGYDAYDLELLVDRAIHGAVGRFLSSSIVKEKHDMAALTKEDFSQAMHDFVPVTMRGVTKSINGGGRTGWDDVGGHLDIKNTIQEMIEFPSKFPSIFAQSPLRLRSNVLLYGPPGCGKTHIVGAAAAACSLRFISIKGPELLNKYIGASEQAVRDLFAKASAAAPCLLFFDEFDSIAPKRGHDNTGVTDRVVNQLLTELDGVETLTGVFVFAATSRPDLLDAALLRPGRLDRLLFCDFPSWHERLDILKVLSRKLPLADDVNLNTIASMTEGFSGADLQALLSDAQLASVHEVLDAEDNGSPERMPVISNRLLVDVASRARPSVSDVEKQRLNRIYSQFLDLKKSVAEQFQDAKGKRATLA